MIPWAYPSHNPHGISIGSVVFALMIAECPYTLPQSVRILYNGTLLVPQNCPFHGGSGPPSNTWFPGPTQVLNPKSSRSVQLFLQGSLVWQTDRQTMLLGRSTVMRPNNNSTHLSIPPQTHNFRYTTRISTSIGHYDSNRQTRKHCTVLLAEKFTHFKQQSRPQPQIMLHFRMS